MNKLPDNLICVKVTAQLPDKNPYIFYYTHYVKMYIDQLDKSNAKCSFIRTEESELSKNDPNAWMYTNTIKSGEAMGHTFEDLFQMDTKHFIDSKFKINFEYTTFGKLPENLKTLFRNFENHCRFTIEALDFNFNILK